MPVITFRNTIEINVELSTVYAFAAAPEKFPLWNYYILQVQKVSGDSFLGSRYHQVRKNDEQYFDVTKYEPNRLVEYTTIPKSKFFFQRQMLFQAVGQQTTIEDIIRFDSGYPGFLQRLFTRKMKGAVYENLTKMKKLLETGHVRLQDGRSVSI